MTDNELDDQPIEKANTELRITRTVDVPQERIWKAWTDPEQVAKWWGPIGFTNTVHEMDGGTTFHFVTEGIERALERAQEAADDGDVRISGGADTVRQYVEVGLVDEIQLQAVPVLFGDGIRLFERLGTGRIELERTRIVESPNVTHLRFRVLP